MLLLAENVPDHSEPSQSKFYTLYPRSIALRWLQMYRCCKESPCNKPQHANVYFEYMSVSVCFQNRMTTPCPLYVTLYSAFQHLPFTTGGRLSKKNALVATDTFSMASSTDVIIKRLSSPVCWSRGPGIRIHWLKFFIVFHAFSKQMSKQHIQLIYDDFFLCGYCFYRCETCSLTMSEACRLRVFENRVFGPKRDEVRG
jgi:hypothetical protein